MKTCPNPKCGKTIENDNAKFCRYCGAKLSVSLEAPVADEVTQDEVINAPDEGIVLTPEPTMNEPLNIRHGQTNGFVSDGISLGFADDANMPSSPSAPNMPMAPNYPPINNGDFNYNQPVPKKPSNYMVLAILTTILCSPLFGIIAIVNAAKVNSLYISGDFQGAQKASSRAMTWSIIGIAVSLVMLIIIMGQ